MSKNTPGGSINDRLDQSINGTPKINPDEQRKYLGTFRERVSLGIKIKDLESQQAFNGFKQDLQAHPKYLLIINGNLSDDQTMKYLAYASQHNISFTMRTDSFYRTSPDDYGIIYASHQHAINQYPINVTQKYSDPNHQTQGLNPDSLDQAPSPSLWDRIKKLFK